METGPRIRSIVGPPLTEDRLAFDRAFEVLSNRRRRIAIDCLAAAGEPVDLRRLSTLVAATENDVEPDEVTTAQRKRAYTALRQTHLPLLDAYEVVTFDPVAGSIEPTERIWQLEGYMETIDRPDVVPGGFYLAIVAAVAALALANVTGLFAAGWMGYAEIATIGLAVVFGGSLLDIGYAIWHRRRRLRNPE